MVPADSQPAEMDQESAELRELEIFLTESEERIDESQALLRAFDEFCAADDAAANGADYSESDSISETSFEQMWNNVSWLYEIS